MRTSEMQVTETLPHLPFDKQKVRETARAYLKGKLPTTRIWQCFDDAAGGKAIGHFVAFWASYMFTDGIFTQQEVAYVLPEYRGSLAFIKMVDAYFEWGQQIGAKELYLGLANGLNMEKIEGVFDRLHFNKVGTLHRRILK